MATTLRGPVIALDPSTITVDQINSVRFTTTFRGYDPGEVKLHLDAVAAAYQQRLDTETGLRALLNGTSPQVDGSPFVDGVRTIDMRTEGVVIVDAQRASALQDATPSAKVSDASEADLLVDARREADEILAAARNEANALVARANDDAARIILRARAESRGRPSADGNAVVEAALNDSNGDPVLAREQARMMIEEAKAVRERILSDLSKRRRVAHVQLEQMRVAREKLVESLREARRRVDDASRDLSTAEVEARIAADAAGRRVNSEPLPTAGDLEIELLSSRYLVPAVQSGESIEAHTVQALPDVADPAEGEVGASVVPAEVGAGADVVVDSVESVEVDESVETVEVGDAVKTAEVGEVGEVGDGVVPVPVTEPVLAEMAVAEMPHAAIVTTGAAEELTDQPDGTAVDSTPGDGVERIVDLTTPADDLSASHVSGPEDAPSGSSKAKPNVEELFARLRREREEAAEVARATLGTAATVQERSATVIDLTAYSTGATSAEEHAEPRKAKASKKRGKTKQAETSLDDDAQADRVIDLSDAESTGLVDASARAASVDAELDHETQLAYVLGPLREQLVRSIKRVLQDEQSVVLTALRTSRSRNDLDQLVGTTEAHPQKFYVVIEPALARAFRAGVDRQGGAHEDFGIDIGIAEGPAVHVEAIGVSRAIVDVLRSDLRSELDSVASPETDASMLISLISNHYRAWNTERLAQLVEPALRTVYRAGTSATASG